MTIIFPGMELRLTGLQFPGSPFLLFYFRASVPVSWWAEFIPPTSLASLFAKVLSSLGETNFTFSKQPFFCLKWDTIFEEAEFLLVTTTIQTSVGLLIVSAPTCVFPHDWKDWGDDYLGLPPFCPESHIVTFDFLKQILSVSFVPTQMSSKNSIQKTEWALTISVTLQIHYRKVANLPG